MKKCLVSALFLFLFFSLLAPLLNAEEEFPLADSETTISMDLRDASLKDILKIFSIQSNLNFIAPESLQDRKVTLYLDKVPIKDAMDKLFAANNLGFEIDKKANIILVKDMGLPKVETVTKVFYLKYASVASSPIESERSGNLKSGSAATDTSGIGAVVKKLLSENGSLIEDARTNSLIVTDVPSRMKTITQAISALDIVVPQVLLEVEMLDVTKNVTETMGIKWPTTLASMDTSNWSRAGQWPLANGTNGQGNTMLDQTKSLDGTTQTLTPGTWPANHFGPTIYSFINAKLALDFARSQSDTKDLARPKILTLNNQTAEIVITTHQSVGVDSTTIVSGPTTATPERVDTGVSLRVTPQVNLDTSEITMFIYPKVSAASKGTAFTVGGTTYQFIDPEERSSKSVVRIKDGETIVIGGLLRHNREMTINKVPILGDLPLIGGLFRHKDLGPDSQRELLIFITPHIIRDTNNMNLSLAQMKKTIIPEREQAMVTVSLRQNTISSYLNDFDNRKR